MAVGFVPEDFIHRFELVASIQIPPTECQIASLVF